MEYNSFYGGRQGTPFIIAAKYDSVNDMINAFAGGNNYKVVAYNEYVIIDTINKNDADNGKIYRRIETDPGYEYIGQIVGPSGPAPTVSFESYSQGEHISEEEPHNIGSPSDLVPGKYVKQVGGQDVVRYNDTIDYKYVVIRDANNIESTIYMGFRIPYPVIDFSVNPILVEYPTAQTVQPERIDDGGHPFYEHWELKIPKGIKGDAFKNFRVLTPSTDTSYNDPDGNAHTLYQDKSYLVYDYYNYDNSRTPSPITYYLGDYNMIDSISEQDGVVTINYTNDDSQNLMTIKYITNIAITSSTGKMVVTYNTKTGDTYDTQPFNLTYVTSAALAQNGTFSYKKTTGSGTSTTTQSEKLTWVENAQVLSTGEFQTKKNTSSTWDTLTTIKSIDHIEIAQTGEFKVYYNTDASTPVQLATIKYITGVEGASGYLKINYNTGEPSTYFWQGTTNSTGAVIAEESAEPEPVFAEGSPWFVVEEYAPFNQELSYLESTGEQYIDLEMTVHPKTKVELSFELTELDDGGQKIFGAGGWKPSFTLQHMVSGYDYVFCSKLLEGPDAIGPHRFSQSAVVNTLYNVELVSDLNSQSAKINGVIRYTDSTVLPSTQISNSLYIFNVNEAITAGNNAKMKLYNCKIYIDDILVKDLIPVLDKNNIPCLYDSVSDKFFYNKGTGQFLYE